MRRLLRSLEKKLVVERTELAVIPVVHDLLARWEDALSDNRPTPDVLDFVAGLIESGFCLTTGSKAFSYLDEFRRTGSLPDKGRLLRILMPWYVPDNPNALPRGSLLMSPFSSQKGKPAPWSGRWLPEDSGR